MTHTAAFIYCGAQTTRQFKNSDRFLGWMESTLVVASVSVQNFEKKQGQ